MADARGQQRTEELTNYLIRAANASGGWGYFAGKKSRIEPTCWALLALRGAWGGTDIAWTQFAASHLRFVESGQRETGLLTDNAQVPPNLAANGLAACTLAALSPESRATILPALLRGIVALKGIKANEADARQNNALQAWPWYEGTFSWLEPTAWCVLALKKLRPTLDTAGAAERIAEAEQMMENRCCESGGWNYGNASALGQDLRPHIPPTATALFALRDRRDRPYVARSIAFLDGARLKELSGTALGMTALCLRLHGLDAMNVEERLLGVSMNTEALGNNHPIAIALYALTASRHQAEALRVAD